MIRLWVKRGTEVAVHEQLRAQFVLGSLNRRLGPGEKLPSVRALARQLKLHANTISGVYQSLAEQGWVNRKRGSGMYVRAGETEPAAEGIDAFARRVADDALRRGYTVEAVRDALERLRGQLHARRYLVVDPDPEFARVLATEISSELGRPVGFAGCDAAVTAGTCVLVTEASKEAVVKALGDVEHRTIRVNAMQDVLLGQKRPAGPVLIAFVTHSPALLRWAARLLPALGYAADSVLLRQAGSDGWREGLGACDIIGADVVTAAELEPELRPLVLHVVADGFAAELRARV